MPHPGHPDLKVRCQISGKELPLDDVIPVDLVRSSLLPTLREACPNLDMGGYISEEELDKARIKHAEDMAKLDVDELTELRKEVAKSLERHEVLTRNIDKQFDQQATTGQKIADRVAAFGGSWTFIITFGVVLVVWIGVNSLMAFMKPFDPYPFVFLNLILSCVAALQAPVIMMSQNRQEEKDRLRNENEYKVNLKAELEIRHINEKIDKLINDQWKHLLEIQQMQMEMIQDMSRNQKENVKRNAPGTASQSYE